MNNPQYIYSMYRLNKIYPGGKQVIKNISLSFLPGAKIGVLGGNGAGKSTLLKIMAGVDNEYIFLLSLPFIVPKPTWKKSNKFSLIPNELIVINVSKFILKMLIRNGINMAIKIIFIIFANFTFTSILKIKKFIKLNL